MTMRIELSATEARFTDDRTVAGRLVLDDPFKPYLHPLCTPAGHPVTVAMPVDHRHHKGLMYALRCDDLNFWEERPGSADRGIQSIQSAEVNAEQTLVLELLWGAEAGDRETYRETRQLSCVRDVGGSAFVWTWRTRREALRDHRLVKSEWSLDHPDGRRINYHGLGIRLPWSWCFGGEKSPFFGMEKDGQAAAPMEACGSTAAAITWWGGIDGHWDCPRASVTLEQQHGFGWFILASGFPYLATGPSVLQEVEVSAGDLFEETYCIRVADR